MKNEKSYAEWMDEKTIRYEKHPDAGTMSELLSGLMQGIAENRALACPAELDPETGSVRPLFLSKKTGEEHLAVLTRPDGERFPMFADIRLRALMRLVFLEEACTGLVFNPFQKNTFFVSKEFLAALLSAGYAMAEEDYRKEEKS